MEWIKVSDRLPQNLFDTIFCDMDGNVGAGFIDHNGEWKLPGDIPLYNITHWMPLPKPPKE